MLESLALLLMRPPTDAGVWLDAPPRPGTVVVAPFDVRGETQAPEGVLHVDLYVVRGTTLTHVATYDPVLPVGPVPFACRWAPAGAARGTVTIRVVATTLVRGFSAEAAGLVVPAPSTAPRAVARPAVRAVAVPRRVVTNTPRTPVGPSYDDSGAAFGATAPVLPYAPPPAASSLARPVAAAVTAPASPERSGWVSVAAGLLLLLVCSHLHRVLRSPR